MKRIAFSVIVFLLAALFLVFYAIPGLYSYFSALNANFTQLYSNLDAFFIKTWSVTLGRFVVTSIAPADQGRIYGTILVLIFAALLVLIVDVVASLVSKHSSKQKKRIEEAVAEEMSKLNSDETSPASFTDIPKNVDQFANNRTPHVSLDDFLSEPNESKVNLNEVKKKPSVRIALTIVYGVLVLLCLFTRFVAQTQEPNLLSVFSWFLNLPFIKTVNANLNAFFAQLLKRIYSAAAIQNGSFTWTHGQIVELLLLLLACALLWCLILLIAHFIIASIRKREAKKRKVDVAGQKEFISVSSRNLVGNADLMTVSSNVSSIAVITPFKDSEERSKQMYDRAIYIEDIGQFVKEAGVKNQVVREVPVSPTRQALTPEEMDQDLSGNKSVTIKDIASIEDSFPKQEESLPIDTYSIPEESSPSLDLSSLDIGKVAIVSKANRDAEFLRNTDDVIAFDEDGYAYLIKEGKPFVDEEEDISDVITDGNLDQTAIISRFGKSVYDTLNSLEPFILTPLDYDEEIKKIRRREKENELLAAEALLRNALSSEPFKVSDIILGQETAPSAAPAEKKPDNKKPLLKKDKNPQTIIPLLIAKTKPEEKTEDKESVQTASSQEKPKAPVAPQIVSASHFALTPSEKPAPAKASKNENPKKAEKEEKKDITQIAPEEFVTAPSRPVGPVKPVVVSIEDYLGKKNKA